MIAKSKTYKVSIFNEVYSFVSDDSEEQLISAAALVDSLMKEIAASASQVDAKRIAVLAALRIGVQLSAMESQVASQEEESRRLISLIERELSIAAKSHKEQTAQG